MQSIDGLSLYRTIEDDVGRHFIAKVTIGVGGDHAENRILAGL